MSRPKRILSAHPTTNRPISAHSGLTFSRKELIENVYTAQAQTLTTRTASAKLLGYIAATGIEKSKKIVVRQSRKVEEMEEEILQLKKIVNNLTEEVCRQKGKT